ncbi:MAG: hypothetical protein K2G25_03870, partial [Oscillospiraceae bacterium]|nr:hypothetical protein [Oscillospiraceae bacterium]
SNAIQEWHSIKNKLETKSDVKSFTKSGRKSRKKHPSETQESYIELWRKQDEIAAKYLKYQYYDYKY